MRRTLITVFVFFSTFFCYGQILHDTITVMYYNILSYDYTTDCDTLRTIFRYSQPDVMALCEVGSSEAAGHLLNCAINTSEEYRYDTARYFSINSANKGNMLLYNTRKLSLKFQDTIRPDGARYIDRYRLFYNNVVPDTIFMDLYIAHLTPNQGSNAERWHEVRQFKNYIEEASACENLFFGGDLNLYSGDEEAYNLLLDSGSCRLSDPVSARGVWHDNDIFASIHTQSTRKSLGGHGGGASGGMDDRFDFILTSGDIISGMSNLTYIPGSYIDLGNDGTHFNKSLTDLPLSASVPDSVSYALAWKSDHLPVLMKLEMPRSVLSLNINKPGIAPRYFFDHVNQKLHFGQRLNGNAVIRIYNSMGQVIVERQVYDADGVDTGNLESGLYIFTVNSKIHSARGKFIVVN